jgi:hypothetical protein
MAKENRWPGWGQHTLECLGVGGKIVKKESGPMAASIGPDW